jgi:molybdopterin converting factor small subunit
LVNIHVKLYGVFRSAAKTGELDISIPDDNPTVRGVIEHIVSNEAHREIRQLLLDSETLDPRPNSLIMVSGREIGSLNGLETRVSSDDELALLPVAHGG